MLKIPPGPCEARLEELIVSPKIPPGPCKARLGELMASPKISQGPCQTDWVFGDELAFSGDLGPLVASIATDDATCP